MYRTSSLALAMAAISLAAQAQITVTNSVFPAIGDTLHYAIGNQPNAINVVFTPPGGNQMWDLSGLEATGTGQVIYRDPSSGSGWTVFPEATLMVVPADGQPGQDYLINTGNAIQLLGSHGADPLQLGSSLNVRWAAPIPESRAPLNFFDIHQTSSGHLTPFPPGEMPAGWTDQFPTNDSMRVRVSNSELTVVDAWGTITIPGGTYAVLREKRTRITETRVDAKIAPLGWLDVTDVCISQYGMGAPLGVDTTVTFHFINDVAKESIAVCELNNAQNEVVGVRYKLADFSTAVEGPADKADAVRVYPNPATDRIRIQAPDQPPGAYQLLVMDATGRQVMRRRGAPDAPVGQLLLDIAALRSGVYHGAIVPDTGGVLPFRFVKP